VQGNQTSVSNLESSYSDLTLKITALEGELSQEREYNQQLQAELDLLQADVEEKIDNPLTGMATGGEAAPLLGFAVLVIIVVAAWFFLRSRGGEDSLYTTFASEDEKPVEGFSPDNESEPFKPKVERSMRRTEAQEEKMVRTKSGKWAFKNGTEETTEEKKFDLGDLLKK
jgi:hypothetical protein